MTARTITRIDSPRPAAPLAMGLAAVLLLGCGGPPLDLAPKPAHTAAVIGGTAAAPEAWGLSAAQQNAVVHVQFGPSECSGTWAGGRVVITAVHCVVDNLSAWYLDGEPAIVGDPAGFVVSFGPERGAFTCALDVEDVVAADALPAANLGVIDRDVALLALAESPFDACWPATSPLGDVAVPVAPAARTLLGGFAPAVGEDVLFGGFGYLDEAHTMFGPRRYGVFQTETTDTAADYFIAVASGAGLPTHGDSGGPAIILQDGAPAVAGVLSTVVPPRVAVTSLERTDDFWPQALSDAWLACPDLGDRCLDGVRVSCSAGTFTESPCADGCNEDGTGCGAPPDAPEPEPTPEPTPEPAPEPEPAADPEPEPDVDPPLIGCTTGPSTGSWWGWTWPAAALAVRRARRRHARPPVTGRRRPD